jgi:predicted Rossmann fold nucleotide-binding protein DprA/Smf involved in DNA uptake
LVEQANDILKTLRLKSLKLETGQEIKGGTPEENLIREALKEKSLHIEKIIEKTGLSAKEVCSILAIMEIKNLVRNLGGNIYVLKR